MNRILILSVVFLFLLLSLQGVELSNISGLREWKILGPLNFAPKEGVAEIPFYPEIEMYEEWTSSYRFYEPKDLYFWDYKSKNNEIHLSHDTLAFSNAYEAMGFPGILSLYYAFSSIESDERRIALIYAGGVSNFFVNSIKYQASPYSNRKILTPVLLEKGINKFSFILSGYYGYADAYIEVYSAETPFIFNDSASVVFDIIEDSLMLGWVSVQVMNAGLTRMDIEISHNENDSTFFFQTIFDTIPSLGVKNIPIKLEMRRVHKEKNLQVVQMTIEACETVYNESLNLQVKKLKDVRRETFISAMDSSIQYYAIRLPKNFSDNKPAPLTLSLHGAGVKAEGQASSYREMENGILVCPTNRGEYGFDWQDFGRIDFLEVLEKIKEKYLIDESRITLTGHSMGGHGAMYLGALYAHIFSGIVPSAGWINFNTYMPQNMQRLNMFGNSSVRENIDLLKDFENPLCFIENLRNTDVLLVHGESDDNVPVYQSRIFYNAVKAENNETQILEYPQEKHWFDLDSTAGIDCVDSDKIKHFIEQSKKAVLSRSMSFATYSLFVSDSSDFVRIDRQKKKYHKSRIDAELNLNEIVIKTNNVEGFTLLNVDKAYSGKVKIVIDKDEFSVTPAKKISFCMKNDRFTLCKKPIESHDYTLINYAFQRPFILVYSTNDSISDITESQAAYISNLFAVKCRGILNLMADSMVDEKESKNIVFIGIPKEGTEARKIFEKLSVKMTDDLIVDEGKRFITTNTSMIFCKKTKNNNLIAGFIGQTREAQSRATLFLPLSSGVYMTEYMIFGEDVIKEGYNGIKECGFY
ncbi:MAG: prolyl oligopeptidase family serine peptidase [bacterium]